MSFIMRPYRFADSFSNDKSMLFDGVNEFLNVGNDTSLDVDYNTAYSWSLWFNASTLDSASELLFRKYVAPKICTLNLLNNTMQFDLYNTTGNRLTKIWTFSNSNTATWYHVVITKAASSAASGLKMYLDSVEDASPTTTIDTLGTANTVSTADFCIGADSAGSSGFNGYIDEVSFWDKELSSAEVSEIYNSGCPDDLNNHSASGNIVSWWKMGDGDTISSITDQIGSNTGTPNNMEGADITTTTVC